MKPIRVLIVDDSAVIRSVISELLAADPDFEVVGTAVDPYDARDKIKVLRPEVITLDIEMPKMDGVTFLRNLMKLNPLPVIMLSTLTHAGADVTLKALELGAIDFIAKPKAGVSDNTLLEFSSELCAKIKVAAQSYQRLKFRERVAGIQHCDSNDFDLTQSKKIVAIGASTGGVEAINLILSALPESFPPIVITQHIPESFSKRFAKRLDEAVSLHVLEAEQGQRLLPGCVYIAPGSHHLEIVKGERGLYCHLSDKERVSRHRPSVDTMFNSLAQLSGWTVTPVLLTGMGVDGAQGMKSLLLKGAHSIVQDQQSSIVWGMPGEAVRQEAAKVILPLASIAQYLIAHVNDDHCI